MWINQKIELDSKFIEEAISKTEAFDEVEIPPELVDKWYIKPD